MKSLSIGIYALFVSVCLGQTIPDSELYLGQTPPGNAPKILVLSVSNGYFAAERVAISNDGKKIFYSELDGYFHLARIKYYSYSGGNWNGPITLFENYYSPALSVDGTTMYFQSIDHQNEIWYSAKLDTEWSVPSRFLPNLPLQYLLQETNNGNYYFSSRYSNGGLGGRDWSKLIINGADTILQSLGVPLCTNGDNVDFCVSRDESYIVIARASIGIFISYHKLDGSWTNPKKLITTLGWAPCTTADNKYLFFSSGSGIPSIYWTRVDNLIDSLKYTNFIPYVRNPISDQTAIKDSLFTYKISDSTFIDDDGNNTLSYSATLSNGSSLPAWLSFNSVTRTFSGTPIAIGVSTIKVTAIDTANISALCTFGITVANSTGVEEDNGQLPKESMLFQNYPNPFNPSTSISFSLSSKSFVSLKVFDLIGRDVATIVFEELSAGTYTRQWNAMDIPSGVYFYRLQAGNRIETKKLILMK